MIAQQSLIIELEDAISSGSVDRRIETLRRVTDLFLTGAPMYSDEQVALFDDVIGRLARMIETKVLAELSNRLAPVANAPVNVIKTLAADDHIEVAGPVLSESCRLDDEDLVGTAKVKSQQHLLAISSRATLSEAVTDVLVQRGDSQVVRNVAGNEGARFSDAGFGVLVERSHGDDALAEAVGTRPDVPRRHFMALIAKASEAVQAKLVAAHPQAAAEIRSAVSGVVSRMEAEVDVSPRDFSAARHVVESLHHAHKLGESEVNAFAKARQYEETVVALSVLCGLPTEVVETALADERPDMVLIITRAVGFCWATAKLILMLRAEGRGLTKADMDYALNSFDRLQVATAQRAVRFYQMRQNTAKGAPATL
jgi:uncharacterized protein (DUF2336 family)